MGNGKVHIGLIEIFQFLFLLVNEMLYTLVFVRRFFHSSEWFGGKDYSMVFWDGFPPKFYNKL